MKCFEQLVNSKFLSKVSEELSRARNIIGYDPDSVLLFDPPTIHTDKQDRRYVYDCYMDEFGLLAELEEHNDLNGGKDVIYYIQEDPILFVYSRSKRLITEAIKYSYYVNGLIPICTTKHVINGRVWFTTMFDSRIPFPSASTN